MLGERDLARAVAFVHAANLWHRDVALVDDAQKVFREVIDERIRGLARSAPVKMARVVLDPRAEAHRLDHFQVVIRAHLQALRFEKLAFLLELLQSLAQFVLDGTDCPIKLRTCGNVVGSGPDGKRLVFVEHLARDVVDLGDRLHLIAPEFHANGIVGIRREHVERVAANAEGAAFELVIVSIVLDVDQLVDDVVALGRLLLVEKDGQPRVIHRAADAVDAAHRGDHDAVATRKQSGRGRMAQLLDLLVDRSVLLDEGVGRGDICLGLVIVIVGNEVHHRVVREEFLKLACELRGKRLVGGEDKRGLLDRFNGFRHGERLARARDA